MFVFWYVICNLHIVIFYTQGAQHSGNPGIVMGFFFSKKYFFVGTTSHSIVINPLMIFLVNHLTIPGDDLTYFSDKSSDDIISKPQQYRGTTSRIIVISPLMMLLVNHNNTGGRPHVL